MQSKMISQVYCSLTLLTGIAGLAGISLTSGMAIISLAILVIVMGLPHGALDFGIAKLLGYCASPATIFLFMAGYTGIVVLSVLFWLWLPAVALTIFLAISAHHFSADWQQSLSYITRLSLAILILCSPSILYAAELQQIFTVLMLSPAAAGLLIQGMQVSTIINIIIFAGLMLKNYKVFKQQSRWQGIEIFVLLISGLVLPPLLHFALYFCFLHSTKHFTHTARALQLTLLRAVYISLPFVLLTVVGVMLVAQVRISHMVVTDVLQYVFIGLFGLTVSHMLLNAKWRALENVT